MAEQDNEYEKAWAEGEEQGAEAAPATEAVKAAAKAKQETSEDEYIRAYAELDEAEKKAEGKDESTEEKEGKA